MWPKLQDVQDNKGVTPEKAIHTAAVIKASGEANTRDRLERRMRMLDHQLFNNTEFSLYWWRGMDSWRRAYNSIRLTSKGITMVTGEEQDASDIF